MADVGSTVRGSERRDAAPEVSAASLWGARGINLFGLVSPAANLGMLRVARKGRRWWGLGAGVVCFLAGLYAYGRHVPWLMWTAGSVHYALVLVGMLDPRWVVPIADAWAGFGRLVGKVMAYPIFGVLYFLVVTPTALVLRAMGKDPLARRAPPSESYWSPHEPTPRERYERQF